jgi:apoptosis-inducing factor 3
MKIRSCHGGIPDLSSGRTERRDRKKEVDMMSKLDPCLRAIPSARGTFGISMKPKRMRTRAENALHRQAAEMLRRKGYQRRIVMLSSDDALPYDRPNLSKDYLAGAIPFDFVPLRDEGFYEELGIETHLGQAALEIDVRAREVVLASDERLPYDKLLLATGVEPVRLTIPGAFEKKATSPLA